VSFSGIRLPGTVNGGKGEFRVSTSIQDPDSQVWYEVDQGSDRNLFSITQGNIDFASVEPHTLHALEPASYTITLQPQHAVPRYGVIVI
jgi:hypothetical protein